MREIWGSIREARAYVRAWAEVSREERLHLDAAEWEERLRVELRSLEKPTPGTCPRTHPRDPQDPGSAVA